jgi:hypothetical protein
MVALFAGRDMMRRATKLTHALIALTATAAFNAGRDWQFVSSARNPSPKVLERLIFKHKTRNALFVADAYRGAQKFRRERGAHRSDLKQYCFHQSAIRPRCVSIPPHFRH